VEQLLLERSENSFLHDVRSIAKYLFGELRSRFLARDRIFFFFGEALYIVRTFRLFSDETSLELVSSNEEVQWGVTFPLLLEKVFLAILLN
jgi:hypothetical protein